jgi:hypothetical protein
MAMHHSQNKGAPWGTFPLRPFPLAMAMVRLRWSVWVFSSLPEHEPLFSVEPGHIGYRWNALVSSKTILTLYCLFRTLLSGFLLFWGLRGNLPFMDLFFPRCCTENFHTNLYKSPNFDMGHCCTFSLCDQHSICLLWLRVTPKKLPNFSTWEEKIPDRWLLFFHHHVINAYMLPPLSYFSP